MSIDDTEKRLKHHAMIFGLGCALPPRDLAAWALNGKLPDWSGSGVGVVRQFAPDYHEVIRANFRSAWQSMYA